ncbi:PaaI family thioesterase [Mycolicibacterium diernhoferi]|uniref:Acyl-coenzyme A thioesterase THEM4 n=1 Tax=Mycolicibacterium diernhoferi TaxID=1801 RepID=A0A1Q4H7M5_9MYCO|nr:PaaI family thioesterase [Mycolicibacterium diernhoferi]OJZ63391.1 thioesterase [Mycolicibacterium diernhoferi]OPE49885.1 thioesterase [Mycolicibacterium diernhoferi]PEG54028.1 PaaI family thioesterase [Mycolicibacterium diernhoferi]QYL20532.1 PaaI family thioesterase [Mycolicibacterium diernhoferi]
MLDFTVEDLSAEDVERLREIYRPLTESVRELIDATIRTDAAAETVAAAKAQIDAATAALRSKQIDGPFGVRFTEQGDRMPWGNAVIGLRNPVAPPLSVQHHPDGSVSADFTLGAAYEGPPGHVHGGVAALILDHMLGEAASPATSPRLTGTISLRYLRPTRLGALRVQAAAERTEGVKTFATGFISDAEGPTVQAEGVFIRPRWVQD